MTGLAQPDRALVELVSLARLAVFSEPPDEPGQRVAAQPVRGRLERCHDVERLLEGLALLLALADPGVGAPEIDERTDERERAPRRR